MRVSLPKSLSNAFDEYAWRLRRDSRWLCTVELPYIVKDVEAEERALCAGEEELVISDDVNVDELLKPESIERMDRASRNFDILRVLLLCDNVIHGEVSESEKSTCFMNRLQKYMRKESRLTYNSLKQVESCIVIGQYAAGYKFSFDRIFQASGSKLYAVSLEEDKQCMDDIFQDIYKTDDWINYDFSHLNDSTKPLFKALLETLKRNRHITPYKQDESLTISTDSTGKHLHYVFMPPLSPSFLNIKKEEYCEKDRERFVLDKYIGRLSVFSNVQIIFDDNITQDDILDNDNEILNKYLIDYNTEDIEKRMLCSISEIFDEHENDVNVKAMHSNEPLQCVEIPLMIIPEYIEETKKQLNLQTLINQRDESFVISTQKIKYENNNIKNKTENVINSMFENDLQYADTILRAKHGIKKFHNNNLTLNIHEVKIETINLYSVIKNNQVDKNTLERLIGNSFLVNLYYSFSSSINNIKKLNLLSNILLLQPIQHEDTIQEYENGDGDFNIINLLLKQTFTSFVQPFDMHLDSFSELPIRTNISETQLLDNNNSNTSRFDVVRNISQIPTQTNTYLIQIINDQQKRVLNKEILATSIESTEKNVLKVPELIPLYDNVNLTPWHSGKTRVPAMKMLRKLSPLYYKIENKENHISYPPDPPTIIEVSDNSDTTSPIDIGINLTLSNVINTFGKEMGPHKVLKISVKANVNSQIPNSLLKVTKLYTQLELVSFLVNGEIQYNNINSVDSRNIFNDIRKIDIISIDEIDNTFYKVPDKNIWKTGKEDVLTNNNSSETCVIILPHRSSLDPVLFNIQDKYIIDIINEEEEKGEEGNISCKTDECRAFLACTTTLSEYYYYLEAVLRKGMMEIVSILSIEQENNNMTLVNGLVQAETTLNTSITMFGNDNIITYLSRLYHDIWLLVLISPSYSLKYFHHFMRSIRKKIKNKGGKDSFMKDIESLNSSCSPVCFSILNTIKENDSNESILEIILTKVSQESLVSVGVEQALEKIKYGRPFIIVSKYYSNFTKVISKVFHVSTKDIFISSTPYFTPDDASKYTHALCIGFYDIVSIDLSSPALLPLLHPTLKYSSADKQFHNKCRMLLDKQLGEERVSCFNIYNETRKNTQYIFFLPTMNKESPLSNFTFTLGYSRLRSISLHGDIPSVVQEALQSKCKVMVHYKPLNYGLIQFSIKGGLGMIIIILFPSEYIDNIKEYIIDIISSRHTKGGRVLGVIVKKGDKEYISLPSKDNFLIGNNSYGLVKHSQYCGAPLIYVHNYYELTIQLFRLLSAFPQVDEEEEITIEEEEDEDNEEKEIVNNSSSSIKLAKTITPEMIPYTLPGNKTDGLTRMSHGIPESRSIELRRLPDSSQTIITWADEQHSRTRVGPGLSSSTIMSSTSYIKKKNDDKNRNVVGFQSAKW